MGNRLQRKACLFALLAAGVTPTVMAAVTEDDIALVDDEINTIKEANDRATKLSGYVDAEYINDSRKSADMSANGDKYGFRMHHLSLFVTKKFNHDWKFFSEIEFEDGVQQDGLDPGANTGQIYAEAINIDYQWRPSHYVRIGRDFTPAGIWSVDHYPPFVPTQEMPMHIRNIFPAVVDGVDAHGTVPLSSTFMDYDVYVANGDGTPGESDNNHQKAVGARLSFKLPALDLLELGTSFFKDTNTNDGATPIVDTKKTAYGFHAKLKVNNVTVQSEYASATIKTLGGSEMKQLGYYVQGIYDINQWGVGYRYDFFNPDKSASPKVDAKDNVVFVNYHVSPVIVCKLEHHIVKDNGDVKTNYGKADYTRTILSIAYYLGE